MKIFGRNGKIWRVKELLPARPESENPEERVVRFRLKPFYADSEDDEKVYERVDITADRLKDWIEKQNGNTDIIAQQIDIANNRKTSGQANAIDPYADEHHIKLPWGDKLGDVATHGVNRGRFHKKNPLG